MNKNTNLQSQKPENLLDQKKPETQAKRKTRTQAGEVWYRFRKNKGAMLGMIIVILLILLAVFADVLFDYDTDVTGYDIAIRKQAPSAEHLFGTDDMGRDLFARVLYGTRYSLAIGAAAVVFGILLGVPYGAVCGYFGKKVDLYMMRIIDIIRAIPGLLMGIVVVSALGQSTFSLIFAISIGQVTAIANITRASVLTVKNQEYVESARNIGLSEWRIIFKHILPNCLSPILVQVTLGVASSIVAASSLSFLGLGIAPPSPEWGALLSAGRSFIRQYPYMTMFPGLAIMITVLSLNLMGDGLRDALDPKLRK